MNKYRRRRERFAHFPRKRAEGLRTRAELTTWQCPGSPPRCGGTPRESPASPRCRCTRAIRTSLANEEREEDPCATARTHARGVFLQVSRLVHVYQSPNRYGCGECCPPSDRGWMDGHRTPTYLPPLPLSVESELTYLPTPPPSVLRSTATRPGKEPNPGSLPDPYLGRKHVGAV